MKKIVKYVFAVLVAVLYSMAGLTVLLEAHGTAGFTPNSGQTFLLEAAGAALVAFLAAQLGITVASSGGSIRQRARVGMGDDADAGGGDLLLVLDAAVFLVIGLWFVLLWVRPGLIAVDGNDLTEAPEYVQTHAKLFVGVALASLAALGTTS